MRVAPGYRFGVSAGYILGRTGSPIRDKSYAFALKSIRLARDLRRLREYELASQLLRAGSSIGANIEEAQAASSKADFVAKVAIGAKEAREAQYWLSLIRDSSTDPVPGLDGMLAEAAELIRLLTAIVKTSREAQRPS